MAVHVDDGDIELYMVDRAAVHVDDGGIEL